MLSELSESQSVFGPVLCSIYCHHVGEYFAVCGRNSALQSGNRHVKSVWEPSSGQKMLYLDKHEALIHSVHIANISLNIDELSAPTFE